MLLILEFCSYNIYSFRNWEISENYSEMAPFNRYDIIVLQHVHYKYCDNYITYVQYVKLVLFDGENRWDCIKIA